MITAIISSRELLASSSGAFDTGYLPLLKRFLSSLPALRKLHLDFLHPREDRPRSHDHIHTSPMKLLLSDPPLKLIPRLESLSLHAEIIDNPSVYEFLNLHRQTLKDVEISNMYGPIIACDITCVGMHGPGSLLKLEKLERLVAPECYFRHTTQSQPSSSSDACPKSMALREASITWQDLVLPIDPVITSLDASRDICAR